MTGLVAGAFGVCAVAVVVLVGAVLSLRSRVDALSRRLDEVVPSAVAAAGPSVRPVAGAPDRDAVHGDTPARLCTPAAGEPLREADPSPRVDPSPDADARPVALITAMVSEPVDENVPSVTRVVSVTFAGPLIKIAALSHGVQHALREESRMRIGYAVRRELKRQRKLRRRQPSGRAAARGPVPDAAQGGRA